MLLYRPLIIDRLPVPLPPAPPNLCCLVPHFHPLCLCLLVSYPPPPLCLIFLPIMSPSLSISSSVSLFFLFSSSFCRKRKTNSLLCYTCAAFKCCQCMTNKVKVSAYYCPLQSSALSSGSGFVSVDRNCFDVGLSCFVCQHS